MLKCVRVDGSVTWQKQEKHAPFFALHDLTHLAVESALGLQRGFFGLIAEGWEIEETTGKSARGTLPIEALHAESIVGTLDSERASRETWSADDFNRHLAIHAESAGLPQPRPLSDEDLSLIRQLRAKLFAEWHAVKPGESLQLQCAFLTHA